MKHEHNAFENQIFHSYREKAKQINRAIELLLEHNYIIVDLESQILHKSNEKKTQTVQEQSREKSTENAQDL